MCPCHYWVVVWFCCCFHGVLIEHTMLFNLICPSWMDGMSYRTDSGMPVLDVKYVVPQDGHTFNKPKPHVPNFVLGRFARSWEHDQFCKVKRWLAPRQIGSAHLVTHDFAPRELWWWFCCNHPQQQRQWEVLASQNLLVKRGKWKKKEFFIN